MEIKLRLHVMGFKVCWFKETKCSYSMLRFPIVGEYVLPLFHAIRKIFPHLCSSNVNQTNATFNFIKTIFLTKL